MARKKIPPTPVFSSNQIWTQVTQLKGPFVLDKGHDY